MGRLIYILFAIVLNGVYGRLDNSHNVDFRGAFDQDLYDNVLDSDLCQQQLIFLLDTNLNRRFLDASGKLPSGILTGNVNDFGDYHQCLAINEIIDDMEIQGKYCTIQIPLNTTQLFPPSEGGPSTLPPWATLPDDWTFPPWLTSSTTAAPPTEEPEDNDVVDTIGQFSKVQAYVRAITGMGEPLHPQEQDPEPRFFPLLITARRQGVLGICIPKVCTATEAINFFQSRLLFLPNITFREYYYRLPNDKPLAPADIVAIAIFGLIGLLLICSTSYDLIHNFVFKLPQSKANPLFVSFSIFTNTRRFLTFKSQPGALECVDGIRAISMLWVIIGHTYCMTLLGFIHNLDETLHWMTRFTSTWITSAPITVDTFFLLSGILCVYTVIGKVPRNRFIKTVHLFYLNRYLRMFPLLAAIVLLQASAFNHVSDGPYWINPAGATENCRNYWWSSILFVQNYVNPLKICLAQTWYLSVDMQLYVLCPVVLVFMFGKKKIAWCSLTAITLVSLVSSSLYSFLFDFSAALGNANRLHEFSEYVEYYYFNTLARAPPFFVGMIYGYILYLCKDKKLRISKINVAILWFLSFAMMAFCIFSIYPVMQPDHTAQLFDNFLNSYMRAIWAVGLGWLIFACVHGYGGPINWFLSLQIWKLPARLSYAMYLIHLPIIYTVTGSWTKTYYYSDGNNIYRFMSDVTLSFIFAFVLCICIDAPCSTLQKLLLGGGKRRPQSQKQAPVEESPEVVSAINDRIIKTSL